MVFITNKKLNIYIIKYKTFLMSQYKMYPIVEARRARWKPFGRCTHQKPDEYIQIAPEMKLKLRLPHGDYQQEDWLEEINDYLDSITKKVADEIKKEKRAQASMCPEAEPEPEDKPKTGTYVPPSKRGDNKFRPMFRESDDRTIIIRDINQGTEDDIRALFGEVERIKCIQEDASEYVRMAFLTYQTKELAEKVVAKMNRRPFNNQLLNVAMSKRKN
jgi:hypothetical protein